MTQLLERAFVEIQKLPDAQQDLIAERILGELTGECADKAIKLPSIDSRHRIAGTRISVYDVLTYTEEGYSVARTATILRISSLQVQAALDYVAGHRDEVMKNYRAILERIERGNPPEIEARCRESQARLRQLAAELNARRAEK